MARLSLSFLGTFQVFLGKRPITHFRSVNVQGLLVYLALHSDRAMSREVLAALLWPEEPDSVAKKNLRQSLYQLRKLFAEGEEAERPFLIISRDSVQFNPDCDHVSDVAEFLRAAKGDDLAAASEAYAGELLPGFTCPSLDFEDWLRAERERLHRRALDILTRLTEELIAAQNFNESAAVAQKQLALEPWRESAHRQLMLALAYAGDRTAALAQYARCEDVLYEELGIEPEAETADLAAQIEANSLPVLGKPVSILDTVQLAPFQAPKPPPHFVDRQELVAEVADKLTADGPAALALVGMGGLGKSSLAAAVAQTVRGHFTDGVLWADVRNTNGHNLLGAWAAAFGHDYSGLTDLASRVTAVRGLLADKEVLIVLDDVGTAAAAQALMLAGKEGRVLLTSRNLEVAAGLNAEAVALRELSAAGSRSLLTEVLGEERVAASEAESAAADEIGELLAHLPLAMEIVAQLLKSRQRMPLASMAARLHERKQRLGLSVSDLAVRTSFQVSWEELDDELRQVFAGMAVFEGRPFAAPALAAVVDRDQFDVEDALYTLTSFSLVWEVGQTRYRQHPLLADFAAEKLVEPEVAKGRYTDFYLAFARAHGSELEKLSPEWENLSAALRMAYEMEAWQTVVDFMDALSEAWLNYGRYDDGLEGYGLVEAAVRALDSDEDQARLLLNRAKIEFEQSKYDSAWDHLQTAERIYYQLEDGPGLAQTYLYQGLVLFDQGEYVPAEKVRKSARDIFIELEDKGGQAKSLCQLGWVYFETDVDMTRAEEMAQASYRLQKTIGRSTDMVEVLRLQALIEQRKGNLEAAENWAREAADLAQELHHPAEIGTCNYNLSMVYLLQGDYDKAIAVCEETIKLFQRLGNKRFESLLLRNMSVSYLRTGRIEKAKSAIERSLQIYRDIEDRLGYGYALRQLGDIYQAMDRIEDRDRAWQEARQLAEFLNHANLRSQLEERMN